MEHLTSVLFFSSSSEWLPVFVCHMHEHECVCARPLMHSVKYNSHKSTHLWLQEDARNVPTKAGKNKIAS